MGKITHVCHSERYHGRLSLVRSRKRYRVTKQNEGIAIFLTDRHDEGVLANTDRPQPQVDLLFRNAVWREAVLVVVTNGQQSDRILSRYVYDKNTRYGGLAVSWCGDDPRRPRRFFGQSVRR